MKIGIITVYSVPNFGSYLQAFSLKKFLESNGHEVFHIKIRTDEEIKKQFYKLPFTRRSLQHPLEEYRKFKLGKEKYSIFINERNIFHEISMLEAQQCDCIIIGSDELWNISEEEFRFPPYFGEGFKQVFTYGMSVGRAQIQDFDKYPEYKKLIQKINYITVRDKNTENVIKYITGKKAEVVCDPTFLVNIDELYKECRDTFINSNKYLLVYTYYFTMSDKIKDFIIRYAKEKKLKLVSAGFYFSWCDYNLICGSLEFIDVIRKAECMVTTTFHGSVMGFLNHQKILAAPYSPKVNDVLEKVGLNQAVVDKHATYTEFKDKLDKFNVDYKTVDLKIKQMKDSSSKLLNQYLEKQENKKEIKKTGDSEYYLIDSYEK